LRERNVLKPSAALFSAAAEKLVSDGRAFPHAARDEIRNRAVSRAWTAQSPAAMIEAPGFHRSCT
jgi:hypothetical protein